MLIKSSLQISEEDRRKKQTSYVLVNRMDRSDDSTQLTRKAMVDFQPFELEFLKLLVAEIICSDDRQVEEIPALHLHNRVKTKAMRPQEAEDVLHRFIEQVRKYEISLKGVSIYDVRSGWGRGDWGVPKKQAKGTRLRLREFCT